MEKKCPLGFELDSLVKDCIPTGTLGRNPHAVTVDTLSVLRTRPPTQFWNAVSPGMWICMGIVLGSSVLVFLLWFIIFRRHNHSSGNRNGNALPSAQHNGLASQEGTEDSPVSCPHVNGRTQSMCEMGWGSGHCTVRAEHGVPLPATELGDSALVTTKTVQTVEG